MWEWLPRWIRVIVNTLGCLIGAVVIPATAYLLMSVILSSVIVNADREEVTEGVVIYVNPSQGIHTDLMVPKQTDAMYWYPWFPHRHFERYIPNDYVRLGWGDRAIYEKVLYWSNLTARIAFDATLLNTPSLMHVMYWQRPGLTNGITEVTLTDGEYRKLAEFVKAGFQMGDNQRPILVTNVTHHGWDAFYEAHDSYNLISTCNEWAGRALRESGIPVGLWTPFAGQVAKHLKNPPVEERPAVVP